MVLHLVVNIRSDGNNVKKEKRPEEKCSHSAYIVGFEPKSTLDEAH